MAKSKKAKGAVVPKRLNASEAVVGFAGFLTGRSEPVILSRFHDAAVAAELADAYIQANHLPKTRDNWNKIHLIPTCVDNLTNVPKEGEKTCNAGPLKPELALANMIFELDRVPHEKRNWVLAMLLKDQKDRNKYSQRCAKNQLKSSMEHLNTLQERDRELDLIRNGQMVAL